MSQLVVPTNLYPQIDKLFKALIKDYKKSVSIETKPYGEFCTVITIKSDTFESEAYGMLSGIYYTLAMAE